MTSFLRTLLRLGLSLLMALGAVRPLPAQAKRQVRVGVFNLPPAISMSDQGQAQGFFVDMLQEVAQQEGWELRFVPGTWQEGLDRARSGEVDLITSVAKTDEREQFLDFCREPSITVWSLLYAAHGVDINGILDVNGKRIAVMKGDRNGAQFQKLCKDFNIVCAFTEYGSFAEVLAAVGSGQVDGGVTASIFGYANEHAYNVVRTPVVVAPFDIYFAAGKNRSADLLRSLDHYLVAGRSDKASHYQLTIDRWLNPTSRRGLSPWIWRAGLALAGLAIFSLAMSWIFRQRVKQATAEIRQLNDGLERELAEHRRLQQMILHVSAGVSAATGDSFMVELVHHLAKASGGDLAFIGELRLSGSDRTIHTLAVHADGVPAENFTYDLAGQPCDQVMKGELCVFPEAVQAAFPQSQVLSAMRIESYVGAPLVDSSGHMMGLLAVLNRKPLASANEVATLLRIFSTRAASELERRTAELSRLELERQMQHAQKLESLGVLAGGIAHDFNNLLTAMLGHMNVAQLKLSPGSPALPHLESLEQIIHRAADLTRQMLAYSGKGRFVVRAHDLNDVVREMTHLLEVSVPKKVALRLNLAEHLPPVEADAAQIQQVVMNLVTNAADAIGDAEGTIRVTTQAVSLDARYLAQVFQGQHLEPGTYASLEVSDTGCGMSPEVQARIFEPFFTTKPTGRGLGLSATIGILKGHRAGMRIYSEPGRGTTFKLLFPASGVALPEAPAELVEHKRPVKARILLVDDEEMILDAASAVLQSIGLEVITASNGREAVERFSADPSGVDAILMDLTMPQMDGREAFHLLRKIRPEVPIILCSGYNEQESVQDFIGRNLTGFLQKPYTLRALEQTVLRVLQESGQKPT